MSRYKSHNAKDILKRLAAIRSIKKDNDLAALLGVKQNTLSTWKSRDSLDYQKIIAICDNSEELVYVLTGDQLPRSQERELAADFLSSSVSIPIYTEISAAAGGGAINSSEYPTMFLIVPIVFLPQRQYGEYKIIFVMGDSMEPTLRPGDPIVIDFGIKSIIGTGVYVIRIEGELFVKRLDKLPDGSVEVISDNQIYKRFIIRPDSSLKLDIVGKVVLNIMGM